MAKKDWVPCADHKMAICSQCVKVEDSGRRMSEAIQLAVVFHPFQERIHSFMAFNLSDGNTDHTLYPSKNAAIQHQVHEQLCAYVCLKNFPGGLKPKDAQLILNLHRFAYDHGQRFYDRDSPDLILPVGREQRITRQTYVKPGEFD
jgi:hypothetical protein